MGYRRPVAVLLFLLALSSLQISDANPTAAKKQVFSILGREKSRLTGRVFSLLALEKPGLAGAQNFNSQSFVSQKRTKNLQIPTSPKNPPGGPNDNSGKNSGISVRSDDRPLKTEQFLNSHVVSPATHQSLTSGNPQEVAAKFDTLMKTRNIQDLRLQHENIKESRSSANPINKNLDERKIQTFIVGDERHVLQALKEGTSLPAQGGKENLQLSSQTFPQVVVRRTNDGVIKSIYEIKNEPFAAGMEKEAPVHFQAAYTKEDGTKVGTGIRGSEFYSRPESTSKVTDRAGKKSTAPGIGNTGNTAGKKPKVASKKPKVAIKKPKVASKKVKGRTTTTKKPVNLSNSKKV